MNLTSVSKPCGTYGYESAVTSSRRFDKVAKTTAHKAVSQKGKERNFALRFHHTVSAVSATDMFVHYKVPAVIIAYHKCIPVVPEVRRWWDT